MDTNNILPENNDVSIEDCQKITLDDGSEYEGSLENGMPHGKGILRDRDGNVFKGEFIRGVINGNGVYIWFDGSTYEGNFVNGEFHGKGIIKRYDGDEYEGNFEKGFFHGHGIYQWNNKSKYSGEFFEGEMHGKGTLIYSNNDQYDGEFVNGKKQGNGFYRKDNGDKYQGDFYNDEFHGNGIFIYENGDSYKGEFINGLKHGQGIFRKNDGEIIDGIWEEDVLLDVKNSISEYKKKNNNINEEIKISEEEKIDIDDLIGLKGVKDNIKELSNLIKTFKLRQEKGLKTPRPNLHIVFTGNPGTGKTTVARIIGSIYKKLGLLKEGHVVEVDRADLVGSFMGETEAKVKDIVYSALDGVLFIDEAYSLYKKESPNDYGKEAIDTLLKLMEDNRENLVVIAAGYKKEMDELIKSNPGIKSRFNTFIDFEDYTTDELLLIMESICNKNSYILVENAKKKLLDIFNRERKNNSNFGNARFVRNIFEDITKIQSNRILKIENPTKDELMLILEEDVASLNKTQDEIQDETLEELLNELNSLAGLDNVKKDVNTMINFLRLQKMRKENGIDIIDLSLHLVFTGNPGTGKTSVARILGKIYKSLGLLQKGHFVEVDRSSLVGQYVGQTSEKVVEIVNESLGGILFIDEAYSLYKKDSPNDYGREVIDTLIKLMEDNRDNLVVIVAGYENEMNEFLNSNPGLRSRFNKFIKFEDYNCEELSEILKHLCKKSKFTLTKVAEIELNKFFERSVRNKEGNFANGRFVRNVFEELVKTQANRLAMSGFVFDDISKIQEISFEDVCRLMDIYEKY